MKAAASAALELWGYCKEERRDWFDRKELHEMAREIDRHHHKRLPKKFPIDLSTLLRHALPDKRPEERLKIFRAYLIAQMEDEEKGLKKLAQCQAEEFGKTRCIAAAARLQEWLPIYHAAQKSNRGRVGAARRWAKEKRRKQK